MIVSYLVANPVGYKNLLQKQIDSDKKAFPVILESLREELRQQAPKYKGQTVHSLIRIILTMFIETDKLLENNKLSKDELLVIYTINIAEVCRFMIDYRANNPEANLRCLNNIQLIRLSMNAIIQKRMNYINKRKEKRLKFKCENVLLLFND